MRAMTKRLRFRQSDLTRATKALNAAGVEVARIEIEPDGRIVLITARGGRIDADTGIWKNNGPQTPEELKRLL
jgi:hypothetical protein